MGIILVARDSAGRLAVGGDGGYKLGATCAADSVRVSVIACHVDIGGVIHVVLLWVVSVACGCVFGDLPGDPSGQCGEQCGGQYTLPIDRWCHGI